MSHTPGPWEWSRDLSEDQWNLWAADRESVLEVNSGYDEISSIAGRKDDLLLIAAAPDLLAACKAAMGAFDALRILGADEYLPGYISSATMVSAAIAKAEGKS